jgi:hypothetical protein
MPATALHTTARRLRDARGATLVEAAIITPLLLLLTFAIIDFGWLFFVHLSLESGVSQATRYGITGQTMPGLTRTDSIKAVMRDATPTLTIPDESFTFSHLSGGAWVAGTGGPGDIEKLSIRYTHEVFVLRPLFEDGRVELLAESSMKNEERFE